MFFKQPRARKRETKNDLMEAKKLIDEQNSMISLLNRRLSKLESEVAKDKDKDLEGKGSCTIKQPCYTTFEDDDNEEQNSDEIVVVDKVNALQQMEFTSPGQKKVRNKVVEKVTKKVLNYKKLAPSLKALYLYVEKSLKDGEGIHIEYDERIFGTHVEIFLHLEDIVPFCDLEPISGNCILVYTGYLYKQLEENNALDKVLFVNPFDISYMVNVGEETRSTTLANRLQTTSSNQIVLAPCNVGNHWILTLIDPKKSLVTVLDPIYHQIRDNSWVNVVNMAIGQNNLKILTKRNKKPNWDIFKAPRQPDGKQCGFFVMRYMKEIIEEVMTSGSISLRSLLDGKTFSPKDIDDVRVEWANYLLEEYT